MRLSSTSMTAAASGYRANPIDVNCCSAFADTEDAFPTTSSLIGKKRMPASFIDSNVLLYLASSDPAKASRAEALLENGGTISVQVLNEVASVARRKMAMSWTEVHDFLGALRLLLDVRPVTIETHELGMVLAERHEFSIYDALIVASALQSGCDTLWTEDLNHGQRVNGRLRIANPFRPA